MENSKGVNNLGEQGLLLKECERRIKGQRRSWVGESALEIELEEKCLLDEICNRE